MLQRAARSSCATAACPLFAAKWSGGGPILCLKINVASSLNQLLRDGRMPFQSRDEERRGSILLLRIKVAASVNQLLRHGRMTLIGRDEEQRGPILVLKIDATARRNELLRDGLMPFMWPHAHPDS